RPPGTGGGDHRGPAAERGAPRHPRLRRAARVTGGRAARRAADGRARRSARLRRGAPCPAHDPVQDRAAHELSGRVEGSRPATAEDVPRIAELAELARHELTPMKGGTLWAAREAIAPPFERTYAALLDRDDALVVVGTVDDTVVGFGVAPLEQLRTGDTLGVITDLFVEPDARAVGVGEAMAESLVAFCAAQHCVGIDALALPGHRAAKNFFEESGFTARALVMHRPFD